LLRGSVEHVKVLIHRSRPSGELTRCQHCHQSICFVPEVGWLDPGLGHSYDICPADAYGNHLPG
jgi:hypothetical protein